MVVLSVPVSKVPTKTTAPAVDVNTLYEKTIEKYIENKYRVINQSDSSTELEKPSGYALQVMGLFSAVIMFAFINWIVGGIFLVVSMFGFIYPAANKKNRVFISILNGNVKTTGYTLKELEKSKKTTKILMIVIIILVVLIVSIPILTYFMFMG